MRWTVTAFLVALVACASGQDDDFDADVSLPERGGPTARDAAASSDAATSDGAGDARGATGDDAGAYDCGSKDGASVICIRPGATFTTPGTLTYGPGFASPLPAMGFGRKAVGYILASDPFTCVATPGLYAKSPANNGAGGKICEVSFDNTRPGQTTGTATYAVTAAADAGPGDYEVGLTATAGTTILEPAFVLRVVP